MDAFEKWIKGYYIEHGFISSEAEMREAFRAGRRAAAEIAQSQRGVQHTDSFNDGCTACYLAILSEADK